MAKSWDSVKKELLKNPVFAAEVKALEPEFEVIKQVISARIENNITQKELADRAGTKQGNISRFERGGYNPSLAFLKKIADGLGKELHIEFR